MQLVFAPVIVFMSRCALLSVLYIPMIVKCAASKVLFVITGSKMFKTFKAVLFLILCNNM